MIPPVIQQLGSGRCDAPLCGGQLAPPIDLDTHLVDDGGEVFLLVVDATESFIKDHLLLSIATLLARGWYGRDEAHGAAAGQLLVGGLAVCVKLPMLRRLCVW